LSTPEIDAITNGDVTEFQQWRPGLASDAVLADMARIRALPDSERAEALEPFLEGWHARKNSAAEIAYYLAAAGMSVEEASALQHAVRTRVRDALRIHARNDVIKGVALFMTGIVLFGLGVFSGINFPIWGIVLIGTSIGAGTLVARGFRLMRRITPAAEERLESE
jgi:hypothetical protein